MPDDNAHDKLVGYVPIEFSKIFSHFSRDYGEIEAECIGERYKKGEGKEFEIPVDYNLEGNYKYLKKLVSRIKGRESTSGLNHSKIKKCT